MRRREIEKSWVEREERREIEKISEERDKIL